MPRSHLVTGYSRCEVEVKIDSEVLVKLRKTREILWSLASLILRVQGEEYKGGYGVGLR